MLNIPDAIKALFKADGTRKNFRVHFPNGEYPDITNANVAAESVTFTESLCSQNTFRFGLAEASVLEFETVGIGNMFGMIIEAGIEIDTSSLSAADITAIDSDPGDGVLVLAADSDLGYGFYRVPYGVFRVANCPRDHHSMAHRKVTAYSTETEGISTGAPFFLPDRSMSSSIRIDENAIRALADETVFTRVLGQVAGLLEEAVFFNSSGSISFFMTIPATNYYLGRFFNNDSDRADFLRVSMEFDADAYYAQGASLAQAIDAAGYDIRYDNKGNQIYNTTLEALKAKAPVLFYPQVVCHSIRDSDISNELYGIFNSIPIRAGELMPVQMSSGTADKLTPGVTHPLAFDISAEQNLYPYNVYVEYTGSLSSASTVNVSCMKPDQTTFFNLQMNRCKIDSFSFERYVLNTHSNTKLMFNGTKSTPNYSGAYKATNTGTPSDYVKLTYPAYSYLGFEDATTLDLLNGYLEAHGQFCKSDRLGGREVVALDPTSPISVLPGDYESVWWDEYDVSPIGEVVVTHKNELGGEQSTVVSIGAGLSAYEMTDNAMLKNLAPESATGGSVEALLSGDFAANAANVGFTPIDMEMQGWPWMEAGDALEITAEDGTIVDTYALRLEISGIQRLTASVEANGGEVVREV